MFVQPNFSFNGIYSLDMNVSICTIDNNNMLNNIAVDYVTDVTIENNLIDYHPYFTESSTEPNDIELNLLIYDYVTMTALDFDDIDIEAIYDWLITDSFAPFISDDDKDIIYYFKVTKISKVLSYDNKGYLNVVFKPFSKYSYIRREYEINVNGTETVEIFNYSRQTYKPIIEITNLGNTSTINMVNDMTIVESSTNEKIIIDNLAKIVQTERGINRFNCCNRKWIELKPREYTILTLEGNGIFKIICEFPVLR